jgi:hypothetical protein
MATPSETERHLRLLEIFHYVLGGLEIFGGCAGIGHLGFGLATVGGLFAGQVDDAPPTWVGWIFVASGILWILVGVSIGLLTLHSGRSIRWRTHHKLCLVVAALNCLNMPFGTILGVSTLILLTKPEVKEQFGVHPLRLGQSPGT